MAEPDTTTDPSDELDDYPDLRGDPDDPDGPLGDDFDAAAVARAVALLPPGTVRDGFQADLAADPLALDLFDVADANDQLARAASPDGIAGRPRPLSFVRLAVADGYAPAAGLDGATLSPNDEELDDAEDDWFSGEADADVTAVAIHNRWYCRRHRREVIVVTDESGRRRALWRPTSPFRAVQFLVNTTTASDAWSLEAEYRARAKLRGLLRNAPLQYARYELTGAFAEVSRRSGVSYVFRRLRPTIAFRLTRDGVHFLAALCLHPVAYYQHSFAGAFVPTDDVIAHLMLMRGDEHGYWKRAEHHCGWQPQAGL